MKKTSAAQKISQNVSIDAAVSRVVDVVVVAVPLDTFIANKGITVLRNEDTTIGNWIHSQNHLNMNIHYTDLTFREYGCGEGQHVAMNLCPGEMRCMWEKRLNGTAKGDSDGAGMCCNPPEAYGLPANGCIEASE